MRALHAGPAPHSDTRFPRVVRPQGPRTWALAYAPEVTVLAGIAAGADMRTLSDRTLGRAALRGEIDVVLDAAARYAVDHGHEELAARLRRLADVLGAHPVFAALPDRLRLDGSCGPQPLWTVLHSSTLPCQLVGAGSESCEGDRPFTAEAELLLSARDAAGPGEEDAFPTVTARVAGSEGGERAEKPGTLQLEAAVAVESAPQPVAFTLRVDAAFTATLVKDADA